MNNEALSPCLMCEGLEIREKRLQEELDKARGDVEWLTQQVDSARQIARKLMASKQYVELLRLRDGIETLIKLNCSGEDDAWIKVHTGHLRALLEGGNKDE